MEKLWFLYFGRLDREKWFEAILDLIKSFVDVPEEKQFGLPFRLFVFGDGEYESEIQDLAERCNEIHYFGFQPLSTIVRYVPSCQYCLMPSTFLETFGLSALNALSWGIPVIGYRKWGLENFVFNPLDLSKLKKNSVSEDLIFFVRKLLKNHNEKEWWEMRLEAIRVSDVHHAVEWEKRFKQFFGYEKQLECKNCKVLMVTDFLTKLGGIEIYVHDSSKLISHLCAQVRVMGTRISRGIVGKIMRYWWMILSFGNIVFGLKMLLVRVRFKPDVIWLHSVLRWIGWFGIWVAQISSNSPLSRGGRLKPKIWWMMHDFGYVHPFPHRLENEKDLPKKFSRKEFVRVAKDVNFFVRMLVVFKYWNLKLLKLAIRKYVDRVIVPSAYMKSIVKKLYDLPEEKVWVLPHFVQE